MVVKCVASDGPVALTKSVAAGGGKAAVQSPTATHAALPSFSIVGPLHAAGGATAAHPQPLGSGENPAAHDVTPTGWHAALPIVGIFPAGQSPGGDTSMQPYPVGSTTKPAGQLCQPTFTHAVPAAFSLMSWSQETHCCVAASRYCPLVQVAGAASEPASASGAAGGAFDEEVPQAALAQRRAIPKRLPRIRAIVRRHRDGNNHGSRNRSAACR